MNKLTKGALSMVLAGSVTFSIANALLVHPSTIRVAKQNALTISEEPKKAEVIAEKTVKAQPPTTNTKPVETKLSQNIAAVSLKNTNKSGMTVATIQQNTESTSNRTTTISANTSATKSPATSAKAPATTSTTTGTNTTSTPPPKPSTPTGTNTTASTTTATNHGQEVSQAAKEKAASNRDKNENNGKKM
ncbi:hypothetical protein ABES02_00655 [Neobacillus pocheonensis]|uniref:hypothetical protein n=1 Tax=Neobacillus pocheonensis TaxID=363869 RepID=UPI003D2ACBB6